MTDSIATPAEVENLAPGQWAWDANGTPRCLVDTHIGWAQRMWMSQGGAAYTAVDGVPYPLSLAEPDEPADFCAHARTQECGHCRRCGRVVADPNPLAADPRALDELRAVLAATSRKDPA